LRETEENGEDNMKVLLTTLNSKFVHSNLAIRYLKAFCKNLPVDIEIQEFSINDNLEKVIGQIYCQKPDIVAFSCYIWNIDKTLMIANSLRKILPSCKIILGGPEVSFDSCTLMEENSMIDIIVRGEGEETFFELIQSELDGGSLQEIKGITYRKGSSICQNEARPVMRDLDKIPFPYEVDDKGIIKGLDNRILYYETSRGCPFNCQYCLSSKTPGVRYFSIERVERDIKTFIRSGINQVKLVDRTFNCNPSRAMEIFKMIMAMKGNTNFHFEMCGDLIDDNMLDLLSKAPPGLFQFEIGVQSTRGNTLEAIKRKTDFKKLAEKVKALREARNIHIHLDLIAGLPEEDYFSFKKSFNDVYGLQPDRLQLGFLKLLKGSGLREQAEKWDYKYTSYPPYEVLGNRDISYGELLNLKGIEDLLEKYYNSHRFTYSLEYIIGKFFQGDPFAFFEEFNEFWKSGGYHQFSHSLPQLYEILLGFAMQIQDIDRELINDLIKFDYVSQEKPSRYPRGLEGKVSEEVNAKINEFFRSRENIKKYLPDYEEYTGKQISRMVHIEAFRYDITQKTKDGGYKKLPTFILFDYRVPCRIFERSRWTKLNSLL